MTGTTDRGDRRPLDPDATVVLPVGLPSVGPAATGPTVAAPGALTPTAGSVDEAPTMAFDSSPTVVLSPVPGGPDLDSTGAVARNSATMAVGSIASRLTGFMRTAAIGAAIGAAAVSDDYNLANTLPNMVYELLLGGVLASVIVPLLVRARSTDADRGEAYAQRLLSLGTAVLAAATAVAVLSCSSLFSKPATAR